MNAGGEAVAPPCGVLAVVTEVVPDAVTASKASVTVVLSPVGSVVGGLTVMFPPTGVPPAGFHKLYVTVSVDEFPTLSVDVTVNVLVPVDDVLIGPPFATGP